MFISKEKFNSWTKKLQYYFCSTKLKSWEKSHLKTQCLSPNENLNFVGCPVSRKKRERLICEIEGLYCLNRNGNVKNSFNIIEEQRNGCQPRSKGREYLHIKP